MQVGMVFIVLAIMATLYSAWQYLVIVRQQNRKRSNGAVAPGNIRAARLGYQFMTLMVGLASVYLLYLILSHQFQVSYVYRYTSRSLAFEYLISAFWAGQEGSFLLWTFLNAIMGVVLIRTARELEPAAMLVINVVQGFFLLILLKASPFEMLPQVPPDGAGLNPLLQNFWMVIHPPILFVGYAAITFPFALAVAALLRKEYQQFVTRALPWVLFSSFTLGAGIIIGGYWAYKVLGWGGYWGWDPVENSSLIPWLTTLALFHGLIVQKIRGALIRTNLLLAILSFALVLYATFLTRSGVLADFSVHSFQDLGINLYLIAFILTVLGAGFIPFFKRYRDIQATSLDLTSINREMVLLASLFVFVASACLTFVGTSSPIFTGLLGNPGQVSTDYYNRVHLPIAIALGFLLGFAPLLGWRNAAAGSVLRNVLPSLILTGISTIIPVYWGMSDPWYIFIIASALFAFWSNAIVCARLLKTGWRFIGAPSAHVGVALLLIGIVVSASFEENQNVVLQQNVPGTVFGYQMTYRGMIPAANGKDRMDIVVRTEGATFTAHPRFYISPYNESVMAEPDVYSGLFYDLYISPIQRGPSSAAAASPRNLLLKKGESKKVGDYDVHFVGFEVKNHGESGALRTDAHLEITNGGEKLSISPAVIFEQNKFRPAPAYFLLRKGRPDQKATVVINRIDADQKMVELLFEGIGQGAPNQAGSTEQVILDVSRKPFMGVLWLGSIILTIGTLIAIAHRTTGVPATGKAS